jgi:hypothetical protein
MLFEGGGDAEGAAGGSGPPKKARGLVADQLTLMEREATTDAMNRV